MQEISSIEKILNSSLVDAKYDGFRVNVNIDPASDEVEYACYFYSGKKVLNKSGYNKNLNHTYYMSLQENIDLKVKIFARFLSNKELKKSKYYEVSTIKDFKYKSSDNIYEKILPENCEIVSSKSNAIEIYETKGFRPRSDNEYFRLVLPINWLQDPFKDRNWMFQLHAWRMLDPYLRRAHTQDMFYVSQIINDWVSFEKNNNSKWLWYDMSTGLRALKISYYLHKCAELNLNHNLEDLDYLLHEHIKHLSNPKELSSGNHGLFQLHGLKSLTYIIKNMSDNAFNIYKVKNYANNQMSKLIASQMGLKGVHTEHSPDYHFFAYNRIKNITNSSWWSDLSEDVLRILELSKNARAWFVFPDNRCVPVGDSTSGSQLRNLGQLEDWPHNRSGKHIGALLDGYAVVRSIKSVTIEESSYLFFQGSFNSSAHKHADDLSFIVQEKGLNLLIDSGKYSYQKDKYRNYFLSTKAHNTIEIDGQNTTTNRGYAYGVAIDDRPKEVDGFWVIKGKVNHVINAYTHERIIFYKPGEDLYVIDKIINNFKDNNIRDLKQWWHFDTNTYLKTLNDKVIAYVDDRLQVEITSQYSSGEVGYEIFRGYESENKLIGWISKKYLQYEPTSTLGVSSKIQGDEDVVLLTRFKLSEKAPSRPVICLDGFTIKVKSLELAECFN